MRPPPSYCSPQPGAGSMPAQPWSSLLTSQSATCAPPLLSARCSVSGTQPLLELRNGPAASPAIGPSPVSPGLWLVEGVSIRDLNHSLPGLIVLDEVTSSEQSSSHVTPWHEPSAGPYIAKTSQRGKNEWDFNHWNIAKTTHATLISQRVKWRHEDQRINETSTIPLKHFLWCDIPIQSCIRSYLHHWWSEVTDKSKY